jgi:AcrR family transcriptional regulator
MTRESGTLEPKQERSQATRRRLLDAAVTTLVELGYGGITTGAVARRAGVTRGAQQHHFASRQELVIEAVRHMSARELEALHGKIAEMPRGRSRVKGALDLIFELYSGTFFAAILELSLAARGEPELAAVIAAEERAMSQTVHQLAEEVFDPDALRQSDLVDRWTTALATIRGLAVLRLLGHSQQTVDRRWKFARRELLTLLLDR